MSSSHLRERARAIRAEVARLGVDIAAEASGLEADELFELTGDLQGVANAVDGAQIVAIAHAGTHETRLTDHGPVEVHHGLGFVDAMTSTEVSLATGLGQWAAGRRVSLAADLPAKFPRLTSLVMCGDLATVNAAKVVTACQGLDSTACAAVDAVLAERVVGLDPARVTTVARKVALRVAADQVAAAARRNRRDRAVQVTPGPDGTTDWWARIPAAGSAAAWAAITDLAERYARKDESLTVDQARADAFLDLLLTNVTVTAQVTLGIPVITGAEGERAAAEAAARRALENARDGGSTSADEGAGDATTTVPEAPQRGPSPADERPLLAVGGLGLGENFSLSTALDGCRIDGIGWIEPDAIETLLATVPTSVGRALLDARTGALVESATDAYRPTRSITDFVTTRDGTCRMWGCTRLARRCDLDHARPWPAGPTAPTNLGGLCRRHHRLKQRRRWHYSLAPDGTATWTSPSGTRRVTEPELGVRPPPIPATEITMHSVASAAPSSPPRPPPF